MLYGIALFPNEGRGGEWTGEDSPAWIATFLLVGFVDSIHPDGQRDIARPDQSNGSRDRIGFSDQPNRGIYFFTSTDVEQGVL
jgi:hypothetical protein